MQTTGTSLAIVPFLVTMEKSTLEKQDNDGSSLVPETQDGLVPRMEMDKLQKVNVNLVFGELLPQILEKVPVKDLLKSARLVSKSWRDEATKLLLKRRALDTRLTYYDDDLKNYFLHFSSPMCLVRKPESPEEKEKTLDSLTLLLKSSTHHTFPSVSLNICGPLNHPSLINFLELYGSKIQELDLTQGFYSPWTNLPNKVVQLTPNLQVLLINDSTSSYYKIWPRGIAKDGEGRWEHLQSLRFPGLPDGSGCIMPDMRKVAPNLSNVQIGYVYLCSENLGFFEALSLEPPSLTINGASLNLPKPNESFRTSLQILAESNFRIKHLDIYMRRFEFVKEVYGFLLEYLSACRKVMWNTLRSSRDTLTDLTIDNASFLLMTSIPFNPGHFSRLRNLEISCVHSIEMLQGFLNTILSAPNFDHSDSCIGKNCWENLSEIAPSLQKLHLQLLDSEALSLLPFLRESSESIKVLTVDTMGEPFRIRTVTDAFPATTHLTVNVVDVKVSQDFLRAVGVRGIRKPKIADPLSIPAILDFLFGNPCSQVGGQSSKEENQNLKEKSMGEILSYWNLQHLEQLEIELVTCNVTDFGRHPCRLPEKVILPRIGRNCVGGEAAELEFPRFTLAITCREHHKIVTVNWESAS